MQQQQRHHRTAQAEDAAIVVEMIRGLAEYEKLSHVCVADEEKIRATLFGDMVVLAAGFIAGFCAEVNRVALCAQDILALGRGARNSRINSSKAVNGTRAAGWRTRVCMVAPCESG